MDARALSRFLLLTSFVALSACGQKSNEPALPDQPGTEQEVPADIDKPGPAPTEALLPSQPLEADPVRQLSTLKKYDHLDPQRVVPSSLLKTAVLYFDANPGKFSNKDYVTVIDFSKKSTQARFFIVNMNTGVVWTLHTAHGKGSDSGHDGYAESFGNKSGSGKSSLGFYRTAETYNGSNGLSLRLDGLSSTNSNARARAIVVHGADYVRESSVIQGRSLGCPALSRSNYKEAMRILKSGSLIYAGLSN